MTDLQYRLEDEVSRGERARLLLTDPLLVEAFDKLEWEFLSAWQDSPARDVEGRETLWLTLRLLKQVKAHLSSVVETGQLAAADLSRRGLSASR